MKIDMEIYEAIRKLSVQEKMSQRAIAKRLGISRNTVKKYIDGEHVPWERKPYVSNGSKLITSEVMTFINQCFEEDDSHNHNKQKHTAKKIHDRLIEELKFDGSYTTIRRLVKELRNKVPEAFIPLVFDPGEAAQIDFGTAYIYDNNIQIKIKYFCARLCYSGAIFVKAYYAEKEECFLDGLVSTFEFFGGVPRNIIFDNAKVAVKDGYGAHVTKLSNGYKALKSHYAFNAQFCNPSSGNEKGLVENLVGYIRRNTMVPMPRVSSIDELNEKLIHKCIKYNKTHKIQGRIQTVGENLLAEIKAFLPLPKYQYEISKTLYTRINSFSTITYETNKYSVPTKYIGKEVLVKIGHSKITMHYRNTEIACHSRVFKKHKKIYDISHYMDALERKPRAIFNAQPVRNFVPKEVLETYKSIPGGNVEVLRYIRSQIELQAHNIVEVKPIELANYDKLIAEVQ